MTIRIESVFVGRPQNFSSEDASKFWTSAIVKHQVAGPVRVEKTNLDGDEQADLVHHGGADKAVLAYPVSHYEYWRETHPDMDWSAGAFGENLSISHVTEINCCIGDVFVVSNCVLQISQPRQPCWKLVRRWNVADLAVQVQKTRRTGWYLRVLQSGMITAGDSMDLIERPHPELTVEWSNQVMFAKPRIRADDLLLASCPLLSESWRSNLLSRSSEPNDERNRLEGH